MKLEFATKDELQALQRLFAELLRELQTREIPLPIPVPFAWPRDDQPDVAVSDDDVARRLRAFNASVERMPEGPAHFYVGRLKRSSAHQWNQWIRQRLAAAGATAPAIGELADSARLISRSRYRPAMAHGLQDQAGR